MTLITERIKASVIDGRAQTPRFKQKQLAALHKSLSCHEFELKSAIEADSGATSAEAAAQYYLVLDAVKKYFGSVQFDKLLDAEYSIARGKDHGERRHPIGYIHIVPDDDYAFYSSIVPLAAAITAGNCVLLLIQQTLSHVNILLRKILPEALENDTFAIVDHETQDEDFRAQYGCILDCSQAQKHKVAAVVDRSADLDKAASALVRARMSFQGRSGYAPDIVLVNEFCLEDFSRATVQAALPYLSGEAGPRTKGNRQPLSPRTPSSKPPGAATCDSNIKSALTILASGKSGSVCVARDRPAVFENKKLREPCLILVPVSSLDDAIDALNTYCSSSLQALYTFGTPQVVKYLSQFIRSDISFANHIPVEILVGPVAPFRSSQPNASSWKAEVHPRYTPEMFSVPSPEYVQANYSTLSPSLDALLERKNLNNANILSKLSEETQIAPINEPLGGAVGFFEQGIITGGTILLSTIVLGTATVVRYGYPLVMRVAKSTLHL